MHKILIFGILIFFVFACNDQKNKEIVVQEEEAIISLVIPDILVDLSKLEYFNKTSIWTRNGVPYSGYAVRYYKDGAQMQKFGILDGKKQNEAIDWYSDGHIKRSASYHKGKLHGPYNTWSDGSEHILISKLNYHLGKAHGIQRKWYPSGEIYKIIQLNMGKEEGIQQAFRKNGVLYANYEAKAGRTFGLRKASLCFELRDEIVQ